MGSSYFYLEFLMAWVSLLKEAGYRNPSIFSLEYSLVPDAAYPAQIEQTMAGYKYVCSLTDDSLRVCVGGDSAGANLILSLLLHLALLGHDKLRPGFAVLISPWTTLVSSKHRDTISDYLRVNSLHLYGMQYASDADLNDPLLSPGECRNSGWWMEACPTAGVYVMFGSEEILAAETRSLVALLDQSGCNVMVWEEPGAIHAWPLVRLFLSDSNTERQKGIRELAIAIRQRMPT